jgi:hypothetical protein
LLAHRRTFLPTVKLVQLLRHCAHHAYVAPESLPKSATSANQRSCQRGTAVEDSVTLMTVTAIGIHRSCCQRSRDGGLSLKRAVQGRYLRVCGGLRRALLTTIGNYCGAPSASAIQRTYTLESNIINRRATLTLATMTLLPLAVALSASNALAQEKQHVSFKALAENSKITRQQNIEVGDVPNHIVRIFEVRRTYPNNSPVINGLSVMEEWDRSTAELRPKSRQMPGRFNLTAIYSRMAAQGTSGWPRRAQHDRIAP